MNRIENLFVTASEEAGEIVQSISKLLRFGPENYNPDTPEVTNAYQVIKEFHELAAVIGALIRAGELPTLRTQEIAEIKSGKLERVFAYQEVSERLGLIRDETAERDPDSFED